MDFVFFPKEKNVYKTLFERSSKSTVSCYDATWFFTLRFTWVFILITAVNFLFNWTFTWFTFSIQNEFNTYELFYIKIPSYCISIIANCTILFITQQAIFDTINFFACLKIIWNRISFIAFCSIKDLTITNAIYIIIITFRKTFYTMFNFIAAFSASASIRNRIWIYLTLVISIFAWITSIICITVETCWAWKWTFNTIIAIFVLAIKNAETNCFIVVYFTHLATFWAQNARCSI